MYIKQASEQSGVSSPNIRFYEKEGLLTPARNRSNAYRDYTAEDVRTLKLIRMLRMLDLPLPTIQSVLRGEQPLAEAIQAQQAVLEQQAARLAGAIRFCAELTRQAPRMEQLDVDACLKRMQDPQEPGGFFTGWLKDYLPYGGRKRTEKALLHCIGAVHQYPRGLCRSAAALCRSAGKLSAHHKRRDVSGV